MVENRARVAGPLWALRLQTPEASRRRSRPWIGRPSGDACSDSLGSRVGLGTRNTWFGVGVGVFIIQLIIIIIIIKPELEVQHQDSRGVGLFRAA